MMERQKYIARLIDYFKRNPVFWTVTLVSFLVYCLTCARHLSWAHDGADGGDFALCAWTLGCPHPTGYPLYCLSGWLFTHIFPFGEVAFRLNIFSAIFSALGAGLIALSVSEASGFLFPKLSEMVRCVWIPILTGFTVAFSFSYWSQGLIVEVYSMNAFFLALISWHITLIIKTDSRAERDSLFLRTAFITGLGFTNHMSTIYPLIAGIITLVYLKYIPNLKVFFKGLLFFILPLFLYLYLPIRSNMNPLMDWGDPENLEGFLWVLSGQQFKRLVFSSLFMQILYRIYTDVNLIKQVQVPGILTAFLGIIFFIKGGNHKKWAFFVLITSLALLNLIHIANYLVIDPLSFLLPLFMMLGVFSGLGCGYLLSIVHEHVESKEHNFVTPGLRLMKRSAWFAAIAVPLVIFLSSYSPVDLSNERSGYDYAVRIFENAEPGSVIFETYYGRALTMLYYHHAEGLGKDKNITPVYVEQLQFDWGKKNFSERYPELEGPDYKYHFDDPVAHDIIRKNYGKVTMYFGRMFEPPEGYALKPVDDLFMVVKDDGTYDEKLITAD